MNKTEINRRQTKPKVKCQIEQKNDSKAIREN
jgi:hypothetical protein